MDIFSPKVFLSYRSGIFSGTFKKKIKPKAEHIFSPLQCDKSKKDFIFGVKFDFSYTVMFSSCCFTLGEQEREGMRWMAASSSSSRLALTAKHQTSPDQRRSDVTGR